MSEFIALCPQVVCVFGVCENLNRNAIHNREPVTAEPVVLCWVVRHYTNVGHPEVGKDLRANSILATIHRQAQLHVGLHGVTTLVLQRISAHFVSEANATPFLASQINDDAAAGLCDFTHCKVQLRAAIASQGPKHISSAAFGVHADEDGLIPEENLAIRSTVGADNECEVIDAVQDGAESVGVKLTVTCRKTGGGVIDSNDEPLLKTTVLDKVGDGCEDESVGVCRQGSIRRAC
jgi:hypothetical protein